MKTISLTQGKSAAVDDQDFERVSKFTWCASRTKNGHWYALTRIPGTGQPGRKLKLHQFILSCKMVDHIDGDGLNNQKGNLRRATNQLNQANRRKKKGTTSRYKGVSRWYDGRWQCAVKVNGKRKYLGLFENEADAARAYDAAAKKAFGEFAQLNFA